MNIDEQDKLYVDSVNGSDANDGLTPETALRTLEEAKKRNVLLVGGGRFRLEIIS